MTEVFAKFFQNVYIKHNKVTINVSSDHSRCTVESISFNDITRAIKQLDVGKCSGLDGIPPLFIKTCANNLIEPFHIIFNISLRLKMENC